MQTNTMIHPAFKQNHKLHSFNIGEGRWAGQQTNNSSLNLTNKMWQDLINYERTDETK